MTLRFDVNKLRLIQQDLTATYYNIDIQPVADYAVTFDNYKTATEEGIELGDRDLTPSDHAGKPGQETTVKDLESPSIALSCVRPFYFINFGIIGCATTLRTCCET